MKRWCIAAAAPVLLGVAAFPAYLLVTGGGSLKRAYQHVTYEVMAERASPAPASNLKTVSDLMNFLHWRMNVTAGTPPQDRPFLDVAVDGTAYCNQIAVGLAHLLAKKGIHGRLAMMRDKSGASPHSVTEVLLDGRWIVVDPLNGVFPGADRGGVTVSDLRADFSSIENLPVVGGGGYPAGSPPWRATAAAGTILWSGIGRSLSARTDPSVRASASSGARGRSSDG